MKLNAMYCIVEVKRSKKDGIKSHNLFICNFLPSANASLYFYTYFYLFLHLKIKNIGNDSISPMNILIVCIAMTKYLDVGMEIIFIHRPFIHISRIHKFTNYYSKKYTNNLISTDYHHYYNPCISFRQREL